MVGRVGIRRVVTLAVGALTGLTGLGAPVAAHAYPDSQVAAPAGPRAETAPGLYLVTLREPGLAGTRWGPALPFVRARLLSQQDSLLESVGAPEPVYRWTTALDGFAVRLTDTQADDLAVQPSVALVEPNSVRPLAGGRVSGRVGAAGGARSGPRHGGRGEVIAVIDSGIAPESPLFAQRGDTEPTGFHGECRAGDGWAEADCNDKVVGARWFVDGFGAENVRATTHLSPRDDDGHGTQMASVAAGNSRVPAMVGRERLGPVGGAAPDADLAIYKACWSAPDPRQDGCATADLVTAIDRATSDGVDVLSLSVGGPPTIDTVERALLGAAEDDVVVVAAAGNHRRSADAAHPSPWVTTVGGVTGPSGRGTAAVVGGPHLRGAMFSREGLREHRVLLGARAATTGFTRSQARVCTPGSLDAARVRDQVVVCERGQVGRVDKSRAVALADGVGMVLVNVRRGSLDADLHSVPTVHLGRHEGAVLARYLHRHRHPRISLRPAGTTDPRPRVAPWSAAGNPAAGLLKPDLVATATGVLGAVPDSSTADGWDVVSGTSVATATTAGAAATLRSRTDWSAEQVRSALVTTAGAVRGDTVLTAGGGLVQPENARRPGLLVTTAPGRYREWLERGGRLNTPSILLADGARTASRTITNVSGRRLYFSSSAQGLRGDVLVTPAAVRLGDGESATFRVTVLRRRGNRLDDGAVVWRGAKGTSTRIPLVISR